jgi:hypothetical protein
LVNLPTFLFVDRAQWAPKTATAAVSGTQVSVTATPRRVVWEMGERRDDGRSTVTCHGPGAAYSAAARIPACGYQYRQSSRKQLGQSKPGYVVTVTVIWEIAWTCAGICDEQGGMLDPLTPQNTMHLPVFEARAELVRPQ